LDLTVKKSTHGISCDVFDKCSLPEYAGIGMIHMPHDHSNIFISAKLGVSQLYRFLRLHSSRVFFISQMVNLIVLLLLKYPLRILLKRTRDLLSKVNFFLINFNAHSLPNDFV
jgi:hypothetical protein